jgi:hypothetical protein
MATTATGTADRRSALATQFCLLVGIVLVAAGIIGFFYNSTFTSDKRIHDDVFGVLSVNGWHNVVHIATGALTLAFARTAPRLWAGVFGLVYLAVAIWGFIIGSGDSILSIVPVNTADSVLHLLLGLTGLLVYAASAPAGPERQSTARSPGLTKMCIARASTTVAAADHTVCSFLADHSRLAWLARRLRQTVHRLGGRFAISASPVETEATVTASG